MHWQIQDFLDEGRPTPKMGEPTYFAYFSPKNCYKMKEIGPGEARVSGSPSLGSASEICYVFTTNPNLSISFDHRKLSLSTF